MRVHTVRIPKEEFRPLQWLGEDRARYTHIEMWETGGGTATMREVAERTVVFEFGVVWVGSLALVDWDAKVVSVDGSAPSPMEAIDWRIHWMEHLAVRVRLMIQEAEDKTEEKMEGGDADSDF